MRILIIRTFPNYMNVSNAVYNIQEVGLAKALVRQGHTCDIVFWADAEAKDVTISFDNDLHLTVFYRKGINILKNAIFFGLDPLIAQYDVIQPCEYNQIQAMLFACRYPSKTTIYHGPYYSAFNKRYNAICKLFDVFFLKNYIKNHTRFMVKSNLAKDFLLGKGIAAENIAVMGVGIDAQVLMPTNEVCEELIYQRIVQDQSSFKLLYVGKLEPRRNILFLIELLNQLRTAIPNVKLYLIGTGNKRYVKKVFNKIEEYHLSKFIVYQEKLQQKFMSGIYRMADILLLPTEYEIFGMVLLEAMYYKKVVITTQNGGSSTLIQNGESGYIFCGCDTKQWKKCIEKLYTNPETMKQIGEKASSTVGKLFTWDALAKHFVEEYNKVLEVGKHENTTYK